MAPSRDAAHRNAAATRELLTCYAARQQSLHFLRDLDQRAASSI
jgi:hypothetical protein